MRLAIITDNGEFPIRSEDLADEICKRVGMLSTKSKIRSVLVEIEMSVKQETIHLGPGYK